VLLRCDSAFNRATSRSRRTTRTRYGGGTVDEVTKTNECFGSVAELGPLTGRNNAHLFAELGDESRSERVWQAGLSEIADEFGLRISGVDVLTARAG
jgi:hypothetical protein